MRVRSLIVPLVLAALLISCGGGDDGVGPGPDPGIPVVSYAPNPADTVIVVIPDSVTLSVSVDPPQPFTAQFTMGDSVVAEAPDYVVCAERITEQTYRVVVKVGEWQFDKTWNVRVVSTLENPTPPPTAPWARPGTLPGTVALEWNRPPDHLIDPDAPLEGFQVAWSTEPFSRDAFDLQTVETVPFNPVGITQRAQIDGLDERSLYHMRIRSIDALGRTSRPTSEVASKATGSFVLSGILWQLGLGPGAQPQPVGSVLVEAGPRRVTTLEDGRFVLEDLPDVAPLVLAATEGSGLYTLPIRTHPLEPVSRNLELVLVPRQNVDIQADGVVTSMTLRQFLLEATLHGNGLPPFEFRPWPEYPVKVWVWEYSVPEELKVVPGGEDVFYHESFAKAIDLWNDGLTGDQQLLEYVPVPPDFDPTSDPSSVGVLVRLFDGPAPWPNLGQVDFVRPSGGRVAASDPQILKVSLRPNFLTQALSDRVIAHEVGHALGLVHTASESNLMHATSNLAAGIPTPEELFVARYIRHGGVDMLSNWIVDP
jgi:hypothetical protein